MGGRALKNIETRRCDRKEFDLLSNELLEILKLNFKHVKIPWFYRKKESFGDIDIVVSTDNFKANFREFIQHKFSPNEIFHNGNCWSFDYKGIQIDIITTSEEHFESTVTYMSGNDLGNLIGRIAQGFGGQINTEDF